MPRSLPRRVALIVLSVGFVLAGANHFLDPAFYLPMMPPYLPAHRELVALSGLCEIAGGLAVLPARTRRLGGWWIIAVLVGVYPANIHMALHPEQFPEIPTWALYARLPFQLLFMAWAWWATRDEAPIAEPG